MKSFAVLVSLSLVATLMLPAISVGFLDSGSGDPMGAVMALALLGGMNGKGMGMGMGSMVAPLVLMSVLGADGGMGGGMGSTGSLVGLMVLSGMMNGGGGGAGYSSRSMGVAAAPMGYAPVGMTQMVPMAPKAYGPSQMGMAPKSMGMGMSMGMPMGMDMDFPMGTDWW